MQAVQPSLLLEQRALEQVVELPLGPQVHLDDLVGWLEQSLGKVFSMVMVFPISMVATVSRWAVVSAMNAVSTDVKRGSGSPFNR